MKRLSFIFLSLLLGFGVGRLLPPSSPSNWDKIKIGMHHKEVYQLVPDLQHSLRDIKGFDVCSATSCRRFWQFQVYYDGEDRVSTVEKHFHW